MIVFLRGVWKSTHSRYKCVGKYVGTERVMLFGIKLWIFYWWHHFQPFSFFRNSLYYFGYGYATRQPYITFEKWQISLMLEGACISSAVLLNSQGTHADLQIQKASGHPWPPRQLMLFSKFFRMGHFVSLTFFVQKSAGVSFFLQKGGKILPCSLCMVWWVNFPHQGRDMVKFLVPSEPDDWITCCITFLIWI